MRNEKTKYFHTNFGCGASDVAHSVTDKCIVHPPSY